MIAMFCFVLACAGVTARSADPPDGPTLVEKLAPSDLVWHVDESGEVQLEFRGAALEIVKLSEPPFAELRTAAVDQSRFPVGHLVLSRLVYGPGCALLNDSNDTWFHGVRLSFTAPSADGA